MDIKMRVEDYTCNLGKEELLIESTQKKSRKEIIRQYKECRLNQGITQVELSKRTGISQPNITRFESGSYNPSLELMVKIADGLGMEMQLKLEKKEASEWRKL